MDVLYHFIEEKFENRKNKISYWGGRKKGVVIVMIMIQGNNIIQRNR